MNHTLYSAEDIKKIISAEGIIQRPDAAIRTLGYDSRKLTDTDFTLFFALKGRRDGHTFIGEAYKAGVRSFVVSKSDIDYNNYPDANFLLVPDTLKALQQLAGHHRRQFDYPVIAITGSNGKTIVKEWLYQLLSSEKKIIRSPKSYNSQLGTALSLWEMTAGHELAIFEAGVSRAGEMEALEAMIKPTIGVLTNIGEAHNEGFANRNEKISEKLSLFKDAELVVYSPFYLKSYKGKIPGKEKFTWNRSGPADLSIIDEETLEEKYQFLRGNFRDKEIQCMLPFTDAASIENAVCCWAVLLALGCNPAKADKMLEKLVPIKMRLELKTGINNCSIIDDSYSSDLSSLAIALDFLKQQNQHLRRTLILSDIPQTGIAPAQLYKQAAQLLQSKQVDRLIGVGVEISRHADLFNLEKTFYKTTREVLENLPVLRFSDETILLKGARVFGFEQISRALEQKVHETVLEINLNALENNLNFYKSRLKPGTKIMIMVKAFSYGSGSFEIANLLQFNKVDYLAVAYADEGVALRKAGITLPIMVMNPDVQAFDTIIEHNLEPEIYSLRILKDFKTVLHLKKRQFYPVHIKVDTGMHRLGFMPEEIGELVKKINEDKALEIKSVFSHLAASEDEHLDDFTRQQIRLFKELTEVIENETGQSFLRHISNTSAISRHGDAQFDMVRLGIGLYGVDSVYQSHSPLETVTVLKTSISQIKQLNPGETTGYGRKGKMPEGGTIAVVKIGYADGYSRKLGNGTGKMLVNGRIVPTIGNICMDMCMLDITGVEASEGDEVIVLNNEIKVEDVARLLGTIPYEVLTGISQRVKRVYFYE